jgi:hypothetical protein
MRSLSIGLATLVFISTAFTSAEASTPVETYVDAPGPSGLLKGTMPARQN